MSILFFLILVTYFNLPKISKYYFGAWVNFEKSLRDFAQRYSAIKGVINFSPLIRRVFKRVTKRMSRFEEHHLCEDICRVISNKCDIEVLLTYYNKTTPLHRVTLSTRLSCLLQKLADSHAVHKSDLYFSLSKSNRPILELRSNTPDMKPKDCRTL